MTRQLRWLESANLPRAVLDDIARHIAGALPREAVGLLWEAPAQPAGWVPLRNTSFEPESSYAVNVGELMDEFQLATGRDIISSMNDEGFMLTLWHSHPSGQVGPSRGDLREKHDGLTYMVIAVDEDGGLRATLF